MEKTFPNIFSWYGMHLLLQIHQIIRSAIEGRFIVSCPDLSWTFALARMPPSLTFSSNGSISGTEMVHDKSGQDTINRPSIAGAVNHGYFSVHQLREYYLLIAPACAAFSKNTVFTTLSISRDSIF